MAREVRIVEAYGENNGGRQRRYTIADGAGISKNTFLVVSDPRTAAASTGTGDVFGGFNSSEKLISDGSTSIAAYTDVIAECVASGAITVGQKVKTALPGNYVMAADDADVTSSFAIIVGVALETASDSETINVRVQI